MSFITSINSLLTRNGYLSEGNEILRITEGSDQRITEDSELRVLPETGSYSLKKVTTTSFDLTNPSKAPDTTSEIHMILAYPGQYKRNQIDGELVRIGDVKLYVDPTDMTVVPTTSDKIVYAYDEWDIMDVKTYTQGTTDILYILQIRN